MHWSENNIIFRAHVNKFNIEIYITKSPYIQFYKSCKILFSLYKFFIFKFFNMCPKTHTSSIPKYKQK
jgi:hypothetical protein